MAYFRMDLLLTRTARITRSVLFLAMLFSAATVVRAQAGRGGINGTITDPSGAVVPGATVTLLNRANGSTQHSVTTAAGLYTFRLAESREVPRHREQERI